MDEKDKFPPEVFYAGEKYKRLGSSYYCSRTGTIINIEIGEDYGVKKASVVFKPSIKEA